MKSVIISDTSCLVVLEKIGRLALLHDLYGEVLVTDVVAAEFGQELPNWIRLVKPQSSSLQRLLEETIDPGEASSIVLAVELKDALLILDDLRARKVATDLGLSITGTLGVIASAKKRGLISAARPLFEQVQSTDFRIAERLFALILKELGEE